MITAAIIPIAPIGPRDLLALSSDKSKTRSPAEVVAPEATIGSTTPRNALRIALNLDSAK